MAGVYIISEIGRLSKCNKALAFEDKSGNRTKIFADSIDLLVLNGHVSITGAALTLLAINQIHVYFLEKGAIPNISLDFGNGKNGFLRQKQYAMQGDAKKSLDIARTIVFGKIRNQISFLHRAKRSLEKREQVATSVTRLKRLLKKAEKCEDKSALRGVEGLASKEYFDLFDFNIIPEWAVFGKRSKHPPQTNVNAVMSYLYAVLTVRVQNALEAYGLDTMCSNLHEMTYGKTSLAYDMVEEFRTPIADAVCCALFNHETLKEKDFEQRDGGIFMTKDGCSKVVAAFENKMKSSVKYDGSEMTYLEIIFNQAKSYRDFVSGKTESYLPFAMK